MSHYFDSVASSWDSNPMKVERSKVTAERVKEIGFQSYDSIVDFGSGTGLLGVQFRDTFTHVHLADSSQEMLNVAQKKIDEADISNIHTHQIERLSELNSKYSAIVTLMTLHHIPDVKGFFADAYDVLESRGTMIIADLYQEDGSFHQHHPEFSGHNGFDIPELVAIAESSGFIVQSTEQYFEIRKKNDDGVEGVYPLFLLVVKKSV
ncbi:class I SAM-dependent DNA methyltransferase [Vibrio mangrovi]|uniref:Bifunctional 3-demethylubiquinone-9 3-methyltransferase/ 2-octaprenyl-6-hydroxy phenol methylase n=1 Tax=Vibrio mangrovi TaxID=474394 RepID=A0A1Y6IY40_9VIBR|nr:class I SAM-dependent methyltransferase [Vibrio mangrovi]MDW6005211.1 methyltransferase domain-containing protein [Vibrio mangrovi]SMS02579.1 bifunctional 3-demethylubiquinone-9 3-methyltransferase/ 2-octaprenyl-6-hydroxy phenol methylase [Vibrio mangrovi]